MPAKYRSALYIVAAISLATALTLGVINSDMVAQWVDNLVFAIAIIANVVARLNLTPDAE